MNFEDYFKIGAKEIDQELEQMLSGFVNKTEKTNSKLLPYAQAFLNANKGGKRIRGVLCKLGYQLATSKLSQQIIKVSVALEILHTALLIHDDIMDQSPIRRDKPSLYKALGGDHKAISQAISLGDIGFYLPIKLISDSSFSDQIKVKALSFLSEVIINTGWGQILDMENSQKEDEKEIEFIRIYKTAKYTIAGPMQLGAMLAGADGTFIRLLGEFGESLGKAFQIQDDILDGQVRQLDFERSQALKYVSEAKKLIPKIPTEVKFKKILEKLTEYLIERKE